MKIEQNETNAEESIHKLLREEGVVGVGKLLADGIAAGLGEGGEPLDGALGRGQVGVPGLDQETLSGSRARANNVVAVEGGVGDCVWHEMRNIGM